MGFSILLFLYQKTVTLVGIIFLSLCKYVLPLFRSHFFRKDEGLKRQKLENLEISSHIETKSKPKHDLGNLSDGFSKKEEIGICLQFKFPSYEEFCKNRGNNEENSISEPEGLSDFIEKQDILELKDTNELLGNSETINDRGLSIDEIYMQIKSKETEELPKKVTEVKENPAEEKVFSSSPESVTNSLLESYNDGFLSDDDFGDECEFEKEYGLLEKMHKLDEDEKSLVDEEEMYTIEELMKIEEAHYKVVGKSKTEFLVKDFCGESDSNSGKMNSKNKRGVVKPYENKDYAVNMEDHYTMEELREIEEAHHKTIGKSKSKFLPEKDFWNESGSDLERFDTINKSRLARLNENTRNLVNEEHSYTMEELKKIEEAHYQGLTKSKSEVLTGKDFCSESESDFKKPNMKNKSNMDALNENENKSSMVDEEDMYTIEDLRKIEEAHYKNVGLPKPEFLSEKDFVDENKKAETKNKSEWDSDELWEHQELIEQLKMELKKVKATGLPTILEESESPKIADDLKPWKMDEKFNHVDRSEELQKFYKSYADRMRKLDILNYQKMYAIGFLQLKDPLQSIPSVSTLLTHNIFPSKHKKIGNDPMMKFIVELQSDLEIVYVGHMCLSWEILHWQYGKALELWETDPSGIRTYNEVAGAFQQFQVLMQRFIEDEPFQGPRVQNYVKSRCAFRNLLNVPLIKEDNLKDKKKALKRREMGDFAITSDILVEILEESIRIFWRFIRADGDSSNATIKSRKGIHIQLQDPSDSELLIEVHSNLQKKEKKLKDLLRVGNCILKKFKKCKEDDTDQVLYFFSQVDMKLVGRVLNMPRITTDQLIWCRNKLDKISFVSKKIQVETSFLLFPC